MQVILRVTTRVLDWDRRTLLPYLNHHMRIQARYLQAIGRHRRVRGDDQREHKRQQFPFHQGGYVLVRHVGDDVLCCCFALLSSAGLAGLAGLLGFRGVRAC
jgi:hypothetical protein